MSVPTNTSQEIAPEQFGYLQVSRTTIFGTIFSIILLTGLLMGFFLKIDFETLVMPGDIALKVGQTKISLPDFRQLKFLSGQAASLTDAAFAGELAETFLFAEEGRRRKIDRHPAFEELVAKFDQAVASAGDDLARSLFLAEELARLTREQMSTEIASHPAVSGGSSTASLPDPALGKLQVRTLLVASEEIASQVLREASMGRDFGSLNASFSLSAYAPVGGDLGQVGEDDLPPGVYHSLSLIPIGSLTRQFIDEQGVHLFVVLDRPRISSATTGEIAQRRRHEAGRRSALDLGEARLRATIPVYVHPTLR